VLQTNLSQSILALYSFNSSLMSYLKWLLSFWHLFAKLPLSGDSERTLS